MSLAVEAQAILRNRWTQGISTQALETVVLTGPHDNPGVQIEAAQLRVTAPGQVRLDVFGRLASALNPCARPRSERDQPLHRRRCDARQHRRVFCPRVKGPALFRRRGQPAPVQQVLDPSRNHGDDLRHVVTGEAPRQSSN